MHLNLLITHLVAASTSPTTAKSTSSKSSSSSYLLLVIIALFALVYIFFLRPRSQRMRQQQTSKRQLAVGDEVMSAGGIFGTVVALDADQVEVEVSPGVVLTFIPRAVSLRQQPTGAGLRGAAPAPAAPVDEPWDVDPDGPGDQAGEPGDDIPPPPTFPTEPGPGEAGEQGPRPSGD